MKIYFVRHGQTTYNIARKATGWVDAPLSEEGVKQAKDLAMTIPTDFFKIYSSDLTRCKQTTEILNEKLNLDVVYDMRLRERNFGSLEGTSYDDFDPILREKDTNQDYDYRPYGGESVEDVRNRVLSFIIDIQKEARGGKILIVTSGGIIRLLHKDFNKEVHEVINNSSIHEFEFPEIPAY